MATWKGHGTPAEKSWRWTTKCPRSEEEATSCIRANHQSQPVSVGKPSEVALERVNLKYWPHSLMILLTKRSFLSLLSVFLTSTMEMEVGQRQQLVRVGMRKTEEARQLLLKTATCPQAAQLEDGKALPGGASMDAYCTRHSKFWIEIVFFNLQHGTFSELEIIREVMILPEFSSGAGLKAQWQAKTMFSFFMPTADLFNVPFISEFWWRAPGEVQIMCSGRSSCMKCA